MITSPNTAPQKPSHDVQKRLAGTLAGKKSGSLFSRLFTRGGVKAIIGEKRSLCCVVGVLVLVDKSTPLDGLVTEINAHSVMFRPASSYILDRGKVEVLLRFADRELRGQITGTTSAGYEVTFAASMPAGSVNAIISEFGMAGMETEAPAVSVARLS
jgi:hypothetical protein